MVVVALVLGWLALSCALAGVWAVSHWSRRVPTPAPAPVLPAVTVPGPRTVTEEPAMRFTGMPTA